MNIKSSFTKDGNRKFIHIVYIYVCRINVHSYNKGLTAWRVAIFIIQLPHLFMILEKYFNVVYIHNVGNINYYWMASSGNMLEELPYHRNLL